MKYLSLFAGVGGFDLGAETAGWECVAQVEWDTKAQTVLQHHWPNIPKYGDVTDYHGATHPADVVVGGFPCQDVSIAGHRAGVLEQGTRSNLYTEIVRIVKEMQHATNGTQPRWVVLENVRGLLSVDEGAGFAQVLQDLADLGALVIEWAMLDSQFFGIPQRRQRVFVVACLDPATANRCPDPLLPVATSSKGNPQTSGPSRKSPPSRAEGSIDRGGLVADTGIVTALTAMEGWERPDLAHAQTGWLIPEAVSIAENQRGELRISDVMPNITTGGGKPGQGYPAIMTFAMQLADREGGPGALRIVETDIAPTIAASDGVKTSDRGLRIAYNHAVRRITPLEAERLQGWPDDHTLHGKKGHHQSDSARYKQIGNGISAPVAKWVAERLNLAEDLPEYHEE